MTYHAPTSLDAAFEALDAGAVPIAGGTDWFPARGDRPADQAMLDVTRLPGFRGISRDKGGWRIGAATRWTDLVRADLPPAFDGLKAAAREVGSVQIQNVGTIAGNLCNASPAADGVPPLLTLDAVVELVSRGGSRRLPLAAFITGARRIARGPDELVSAIHIPDLSADVRSAFLKAGSRKYMVISIAMVAVTVHAQAGRIIGATVAVGACSPIAQRLAQLEADLAGCAIRDLPAVTPAHLADLAPIADVRGSADYRREIVAEMIARALREALGRGRAGP